MRCSVLTTLCGLALQAALAGAQTPPPVLDANWFASTFGLSPPAAGASPAPIVTPAPGASSANGAPAPFDPNTCSAATAPAPATAVAAVAPPAPAPAPVAEADSPGPFYQMMWMAHNGTLGTSTLKGGYSATLTLNNVQRTAPFAVIGGTPRLLVGDYPAQHLFNTSTWFAGVPAVVVAAPQDATQANRSAWVMALSTPLYNASAVPSLTLLAKPITLDAAGSLRKGGLAETYLNNGTAGASAVGAWPDLTTPLFLSNITVFMEVACDGLPRPAGGTCVAPSAGSAAAAAPAGARVATAADAGSAAKFAAGAALDACTGVSGNWVKGIFCA
ncbi:hypothetical protein WJX81_005868 [Elliptochloris bilobata]|uniref:Uncharacterized protein n=1 Tax=Elliptochloris bilobata TaxID=381761 RepID=A0AAW1S3H0_9CHLO